MGYILGIGGANLDIHMKVFQDYILHDSNPGRLFTSTGGVTRNILENIALLGLDCRLISAVGKDAFGRALLEACKSSRIDTQGVYIDEYLPTASYIDLLDKEGDMYIAACDCSVLEEMPSSWIEEHSSYMKEADAIVCDTNFTEKQLELLVSEKGDTPIFIDPVSTAKALRMKAFSGSFEYIKPNLIELETLSDIKCLGDSDIQKACELLLSRGSRAICVSLGKEGCYYADSDGNRFKKSLGEFAMVNASGAGDAFTAGWVYAFCQGFDAEKTVDYALAAGAFAVMGENTINSEMSVKKLEDIIALSREKI